MDFTQVNCKDIGNKFSICFSGKEIKTPAQKTLTAPNKNMADEIVKEWHELDGKIDWAQLPISSHLSAVLDNEDSLEKWREELVSFARNDLLCYLAMAPLELKQKQEQKWLPLVEKFNKELGTDIKFTYGIAPIKQSQETTDKIANELENFDIYEIFTLRSWAGFLSSFILAYAMIKEWIDMKEAFEMSLLDEEWQEQHWGKDGEAMKARDNVLKEFENSYNFYKLLK